MEKDLLQPKSSRRCQNKNKKAEKNALVMKNLLVLIKTCYPNDIPLIAITCHLLTLLDCGLISYGMFETILIYIITQKNADEISKNVSKLNSILNSIKSMKQNNILPLLLQILVASQFFITKKEDFISLFKCFRLFSTKTINKKETIKWIDSLLPHLGKFFYVAISEEKRSSFDPATLLKLIKAIPESTKKIAFSQTIFDCLEEYKDKEYKDIYNELIEMEKSPNKDKVTDLKIEIYELRSAAYYRAYCDNILYMNSKTVTNPMTCVMKILYGDENQELYGTKIFGERCFDFGKEETKKYKNEIKNFLETLSAESKDYRIIYAKQYYSYIIERDLFFNGMIMENSKLLLKIVNAANEIAGNTPETQVLFNEFKKILSGSSFYVSFKFAACFVFLNELFKIFNEKDEQELTDCVKEIQNNNPPYIRFEDPQLYNIDILFKGFIGRLNKMNEMDKEFGKVCKLTKSVFVVKVNCSDKITLTSIENINYG